ncbi:MarR family transcriptional regulator [Hahella sp. CCB-MM4]|uniref:MarR family winged helix-turn-helix transcriptional regulator n=1 Tax=Hahella sp. (strain CCB-MM4) TaxID=1926491 RepID=UPI000B9B6198|nr:MarR family transcriptional regulator [Hahella sp. CCB-MM4]OZG74080.1 MarR family transcriptional regulator [Hahella sp. CCB-MM4]
MGDEELLALDNQLCFLLYSSSRMMTALYRPLLDQLGLTYPQYLVLLVMWEYQGREGDRDKEVTIKMLGERLLLDTGTLTPLLKRMEQQGLLVRQRAVNDERKVLVSLTPRAQELKAGAAEIPRALLCHSSLGDEELIGIRDGLRLLLNELVSK